MLWLSALALQAGLADEFDSHILHFTMHLTFYNRLRARYYLIKYRYISRSGAVMDNKESTSAPYGYVYEIVNTLSGKTY